MSQDAPIPETSPSAFARRHLLFGWWSLLLFLALGFVLELLHGFKIGFYLNVSNETRRLMWTLAHAHGTLLALIHLAFSATACSSGPAAWQRWASACLVAASVLLPGGFFLGGVFIYDGDPGLGVLLAPLGATLLFVAVFLTARGLTAREPSEGAEVEDGDAEAEDGAGEEA